MDNKQKQVNWWCPQCNCEVAPENVTYTELHDERSGGCGDPVLPEKLMDNTDKLKEIREKYITDKGGDVSKHRFSLFHDDINAIQSETLEYGNQLGREEVINEIEEWTKEKLFEVSVGRNLNLKVLSLSNIIDKLNSLKNP